jgi:transposase
LIVDLARFMTLADIAGWLSLSWETVRTVVQRRLEKDYRRIGYRKVHAIAIDELYLGRTHKYVTLVMDLESGRIIWVEQGRGSQALREFWRRFKLSGARLKAVAMDMSGAYAASVRAHAPHAMMTFDRFHVIKLMNERLDDLRRELARAAQDHHAKEAIKGLRWLLLHRRDNLEKDAARRLQRSLALNEPLQCAYLLKEELGELWEQKNGREAWGFLREWCAKAKASGIRQLHAENVRRETFCDWLAKRREYPSRMSDHIYKKIELVGSSPVGIEDAVQNALSKASKSLRNLRWFEVLETRGHVEGSKIDHWQVTIDVGFTLDE